jgi:hypothetical protein
MSKNESKKPEKLTPWIIAVVAIVLVAIATYMNYGPRHFGATTDVSATRLASNFE